MHLARAASRELRRLDKQFQLAIIRELEGLQTEPRPPGVEKLGGHPGFFRIRVGDFRVVYAIPRVSLVVVCVIRDRKNSYKGLSTLSAKLNHAINELDQDLNRIALFAKM